MKFLTHKKLTLMGAGGMIGSNIAQISAILGLTPNICLYNPKLEALEGVNEEMRHCGFKNVHFSYTNNVKTALTDAEYIIAAGGAPRQKGMTREDLLKCNSEIASELGCNIKRYCPNVKHVTVVFNPADITGLITLVHSGLKPSQVTTLAALDSIRLQSELAKHFNIHQSEISHARTYGGHGEMMAVFPSVTQIQGKPLTDLINTDSLSKQEWLTIKKNVIKGGARIIELRGRSSFQSPAYLATKMIEAAMGGEEFLYPSGSYPVTDKRYPFIMMARENKITKEGVVCNQLIGSTKEFELLDESYNHLCALRDQVIAMGFLPPISEWSTINPNL